MENEQDLGGVSNQDTNSGNNEESSDSSNSSANAVSKSPEEKLLKQSQVNEIVGNSKREAYEKGRQDAQAEYDKQKAQASRDTSIQSPQNLGGIPQNVSEDRIREMFKEESQRAEDRAMANKIASEFSQKLTAAKEKYSDLDEVVSSLNLPSVPHLVQWANGLDNTADVIYNIGKHPAKLANLLVLSNSAPHLAIMELQKLSRSIKDNEQASKEHTPNEPLNQETPSNTSTDNGQRTIRDLKNDPDLRG